MELTDEIMNELWSVYPDDASPSDGVRAMITAYEAMRPRDAATVAPELTNKIMNELWSVYPDDASPSDGVRAMIGAYEAMRQPYAPRWRGEAGNAAAE